jgi:hypothetical protein
MATNPEKIRGQCLCSTIKFHLQTPTAFVAHCHCESCRLSHGSAFVTWTAVPIERFFFEQGEEHLKWFDSSEWIQWGFCSKCGSSMLYRAIKEGHPENPKLKRMYVAVGSLIDELDQPPGAHVSYEEHTDWIEDFDQLPRYRAKSEEKID